MIEKLLCLMGFHDKEAIPSKNPPPVWMLVSRVQADGWHCHRCNKRQEPFEWDKPKPKRKPKGGTAARKPKPKRRK